MSVEGAFKRTKSPEAATWFLKKNIEEVLVHGNRVFVSQEAVGLDNSTALEIGPQYTKFIETFWDQYRNKWQLHKYELGEFYTL